jgi:hypothetical protein
LPHRENAGPQLQLGRSTTPQLKRTSCTSSFAELKHNQ